MVVRDATDREKHILASTHGGVREDIDQMIVAESNHARYGHACYRIDKRGMYVHDVECKDHPFTYAMLVQRLISIAREHHLKFFDFDVEIDNTPQLELADSVATLISKRFRYEV